MGQRICRSNNAIKDDGIGEQTIQEVLEEAGVSQIMTSNILLGIDHAKQRKLNQKRDGERRESEEEEDQSLAIEFRPRLSSLEVNPRLMREDSREVFRRSIF